MDLISAEEFFKQDEKVQTVLRDYWKPEKYDVTTDYIKKGDFIETRPFMVRKYEIEDNIEYVYGFYSKYTCFEKDKLLPPLTEEWLRKFIEEKYVCKVMVEYTICENIVIKLGKINKITGSFEFDRKFKCPKNRFDLLHAYWTVACEIAKI